MELAGAAGRSWRGEGMGAVGCEDATVQGAGSEEIREEMGGDGCRDATAQGSDSEEMGSDGCEVVTAQGADSEEMGETAMGPNPFSFLRRAGFRLRRESKPFSPLLRVGLRQASKVINIADIILCKIGERRYMWEARAAAAMDAARSKRWVVWMAIFVALILAMPDIYLDEDYQDFADQRLLLPGIPHTLNVLSSITFSFVGLAGIIMFCCKCDFMLCSWRDHLTWIPLFVALTVVGFGSCQYHLNPKPRNTNIDKLPMILAFTSTMAIFIVEWFDDRVGRRSFAPPFSQSSYWLWAAGFYLLGRVGGVADKAVYRWMLQIISGHTVEHLCAAVATALSTLALAKRSVEIDPERSPVYYQLKFALMSCVWFSRMICLLVLEIVTEVPATVYEIILLMLESIAHLVVGEKQSISEAPLRVRQLMMEHRGLWGMDDYKRKVHKFLESQLRRDSILGFWGISGVGKTRLLFLISDCYGDVDSPFRYIMALKHGDVRDMQQNIASFLNLDWNAMSSSQENRRANIISEQLKNASFLLMLDDVQDRDLDLVSIGVPMPLCYRQKVILTSKSQAACGRMGCSKANTVEMKCLGEEDAWNLFKYKVGVEITEDDVEIHKMAKLMLSACGGLPKAISSIGVGVAGATYSGMNPDDWLFAYERFKANKLHGYSGLVGVDILQESAVGVDILQESAGPSEAQVSDLQTVSSSSQSSAGPSKRGKAAVPRTTPGPRRGLRSDKEGYVELALPNAPSRRKVSRGGGSADSRDAEDHR